MHELTEELKSSRWKVVYSIDILATLHENNSNNFRFTASLLSLILVQCGIIILLYYIMIRPERVLKLEKIDNVYHFHKRALKVHCLRQIIRGKGEEILERDVELREEFPGPVIRCISISIYPINTSGNKIQSSWFQPWELDTDLPNQVYSFSFLENEIDQFVMVINLTKQDDSMLTDYLERLKLRWEEKHPFRFALYIGDPVESIEELTVSYQSAYARSRTPWGGDQEARLLPDIDCWRSLQDLEKNMRLGDLIGVNKNLTEFEDLLSSESLYGSMKISICHGLLHALFRLVSLLGPQYEQYKGEIIKLIHIHQFPSLQEFLHRFRSLAESVTEEITKKTNHHESNIGKSKKVLEYLHQNYGSPNLTVQQIADYMGVSVSTLGQIMRETTGSPISEHLNRIRIHQAKELLSRGISVKEVVWKIGYSDASSFIKKFKQEVGQTPGEYGRLFPKST